ncbi:MAG: DNA-formamidopyrimidine glycosylase [Candidatus Moranbacteria bacterium RIFCSPHIGHO2_01_FULL_55_24]|nr:MAG: DNA-formamidopyrimidine glycosylase [Candidatus Moranbacteria bacterium RIFCSPHIGHO2_01_FULL_55_24]
MPELPEVQTVVVQLDRKITGKTIRSFWSDWGKKIYSSKTTFAKKIKGAAVLGVRRFGKHIVIDLDNGYSIVAHLKMTGHFLYKTEENRDDKAFTEDPINGYIHHIITFSDGATLEFSDMRKFGWLRAVETGEAEMLSSIMTLGIDALSPKLTQDVFKGLLLARSSRPIGAVLLEQHLIAGIGNIYRSEALFLAGILPMRRIADIKPSEWPKILPAIKKVLRHAVRLHGTSDGDFRDTDGLPGRFQRTLFVYRRQGEPCKKCGTIIVRKKMGQRSVFYCSSCQK